MKKSGESQDDERIFIEHSLKLSELSENNEIQFTLYQEQSKALTVSVHLDTINAVIRRIISDSLTGEMKNVEYDADPEKGGVVVSEEVLDIQEALQNSRTQQLFDFWLIDSVVYVLKHLLSSLANTLGQLEYEAALDWAKNAGDKINKGGYIIDNKVVKVSAFESQHQIPPPKLLLEESIQHQLELIKSRLGIKGRGGSKADHDLSQLAHFFEQTYPKVEDAKTLYKQNKNRKEWRDIVRIAHPDLPSDLLDRLDKNSTLPDDILSKLAEKGGSSAPSDIALEYAARLCGVPPYGYSIRHLKDALARQGMSVKIVKAKRPV